LDLIEESPSNGLNLGFNKIPGRPDERRGRRRRRKRGGSNSSSSSAYKKGSTGGRG